MPLDEILNVGGVRSRDQIIGLGGYWKDVRREYSNGYLIYEGKHYKHNMPETDEDWAVWKYTSSVDGDVRVEGPLIGAWANRSSLNWGFEGVAVSKKLEYEQMSLNLFGEIVYQLKMMNLHLMSISGENFFDGDLEK